MVLYRACLDKWAEFKIPLHKVLPLNQLVIFGCVLVGVSCNIFLYQFLAKQTENNSALTENDKKKKRKRNLVPANTGLAMMVTYGLSMFVFALTYGYESDKFDSASRAFINAAYSDFHHCVCSPGIILWGSFDSRKILTDFLAKWKAKARDFFEIIHI